jgi:hypothetical protein
VNVPRKKMERDILKKVAAYFAKGSLPGTHRQTPEN